MSLFKKAVKTSAKLRLAIAGPSGSGKTYTSLAIATALVGDKPIALVDTEHGSASKYAGIFTFDVAEMHPPFHPDKFIAALNEAQEAGYACIILDSISHAWAGTGGVLDLVDEAAKRSKSGNTYMAWKEGTPVQNRMIDAIVQSGLHVIVTMRSKTEYVLADTGNGKQAPRKVGMAPVQRDQFEYEFDVVFDMDVENNAIVSKTRCPALTGRVFAKPGENVAGLLRDWLSDGAPVTQPSPAQPAQSTQQSYGEQRKSLFAEMERLGKEVYGDGWPETIRANVKRITGDSDGDRASLRNEQIQAAINDLHILQKRRQSGASSESLDDSPELDFNAGQPVEDNPFDSQPTNDHAEQRPGVITKAQLNTLHALGVALYGNQAVWDAKRPGMVDGASKQRTKHSDELWQAEAKGLTAILEKKVRAEYVRLAQLLADVSDDEAMADVANLEGVKLAKELHEMRKRTQGAQEPVAA